MHFVSNQTLRVMRLTAFLLLTLSLHVSARLNSQTITYSGKKISLQKLFQEVEKQTDYLVILNADLLKKAKTVTVAVKNVSVTDFMNEILKDQSLDFIIRDKSIFIKEKNSAPGLTEANSRPALILAPPSINISGRVVDENGQPVSGASITIRGSKKGTSTNAEGMFELNDIDEKAVLIISGINIENQEIHVEGRKVFTISVKQVIKEEEEVTVAYNKISAKSNVGAVTVVKGEAIKDLPNRSFERSLQGLVPGLQITKGTGQPGAGVGNFVLRGISTGGDLYNGGVARNPLIVIDGVPVQQEGAQINMTSIVFNSPMAQLNPSDINNITVLKDAVAIALYGSKASNGVILVTTKKGKAGKTTYNFRHQTDLNYIEAGGIKTLNQEGYMQLLYETYKNTDPTYWTDELIKSDLIKKFPYQVNSNGDTSFFPDPDWKSVLHNKAAATITNELSISGGNDKNTYYLNLEHLSQNGIEKGTGFDRTSLRFNFENKPQSWLKYGINSTVSYSVQNYNEGAGYAMLTSVSPLNAIYDQNGNYINSYSWGFAPSEDLASNSYLRANPLMEAKLNINRNKSYRGITNLYGEINFLRDFVFNTNLGVNFMATEALEKLHPLLPDDYSVIGKGSLYERQIHYTNLISTNLLRYSKQIHPDHGMNILIGHEAQVFNNKTIELKKGDISLNPEADQLNIGINIITAQGNLSRQRMLSYFGQFNYNYQSKYFLTASVRKDGSSLFGSNNQFGNHWSVGAGWVLTEENFLKDMNRVLDYVKLRGSIGSAGNSSSISSLLRYDPIIQRTYLGQATVVSNIYANPGNPSIRWEKTLTWDAGIEAKLFGSRLQMTADIYNRKTTDLVAYNIEIPLSSGFNTFTGNLGNIINKGVELSLNIDLVRNQFFKWLLSANWSKNTNHLTKAYFPIESVGGGYLANEEGRNYNSFYMKRWAGVDPGSGRPQWIDSTGKPSTNSNAAKKQFVGKPQPDGFGSITNSFFFQGFEVSFMLYYQYGFQIYDQYKATALLTDGKNPFINQSREALDRWQKPGDIASNPRRLLFGRNAIESDNGSQVSTRYLFDGDFIKLSNVRIGYTIPAAIVQKIKASTIRVFIQGNNLKTWTKFPGYDPEAVGYTGTLSAQYPFQKVYSAGLNVTF